MGTIRGRNIVQTNLDNTSVWSVLEFLLLFSKLRNKKEEFYIKMLCKCAGCRTPYCSVTGNELSHQLKARGWRLEHIRLTRGGQQGLGWLEGPNPDGPFLCELALSALIVIHVKTSSSLSWLTWPEARPRMTLKALPILREGNVYTHTHMYQHTYTYCLARHWDLFKMLESKSTDKQIPRLHFDSCICMCRTRTYTHTHSGTMDRNSSS